MEIDVCMSGEQSCCLDQSISRSFPVNLSFWGPLQTSTSDTPPGIHFWATLSPPNHLSFPFTVHFLASL